MDIKSAYSESDEISTVVKDIKKQFGKGKPKVVLFFSSTKYDLSKLGKAFEKEFKDATVFGCTTSGEIVSGRMLDNSVVAMSFNSRVISDIDVQVVKNISEKTDIKKAFKGFEKHFSVKLSSMDIRKYVGMILVDGLRGAEERLMDKIGDLADITFIGGSAGDDLKFKETLVYAKGKAYTDAAILVLMRTVRGFDILKTQSFEVTKKKLLATKVKEETREVLQFNKKPAAEEYARLLKVKADKLSEKFMHNPLGLMVGKEPYVRSPQQISGKKVKFYCNIKKGMELSILESTDIVKDTKKAVAKKMKELSNVAGIVNFHCILRTLELKQKKMEKRYGNIFADVPTIGFSTYGEEYLGHINQTSTMLFFK